ncbi:hypothetical protein ACTMTI_11735 [Nonomuraea sp. H19]|uniref:hypothetical protein n=1 Tax=Nonomuraea sp. H19 TaxID=3452206 RepID=UPI003F89C582
MPTRSAAVLASGTANAAKLFVAALAFTSAYVGFSAYSNAGSATQPARATTVALSAREMTITEDLTAAARPGTITVTEQPGPECVKTYVARTVVTSPAQSVRYAWKLTRWSPVTKSWRTYLVDYDGFAGAPETVEWRARISGNPGWYRVELAVNGAETVTSDRFQVSC